jgi:hypothetical protein
VVRVDHLVADLEVANGNLNLEVERRTLLYYLFC